MCVSDTKIVIWHSCDECMPEVDKFLFIILKKVPYGVFTGDYDMKIPNKPFYICGIGRVSPDSILYWAEVPSGFMPQSLCGK